MEEIKKLLETQKNMMGDVAGKVDGLYTNQKDLDARLKDIETRMAPGRGIGISVPGLEDEAKKFSFLKASRAIVTKDWSNAGFEREVFNESNKKAMSMGADTSMGYFVPNEILAGYIELLRAESVVMSMGATVLSGLNASPIQMPKQTGGATGYWLGENESITESSLTAGQINLTPKKVGALVKLSNELLKYSNPSVEQVIRNDLFATIALKVDLAALRGSGAEYEPRGIANTSGINTVAIGTDGGAPTFDHLYDMQYELQKDNAYRGNLGFVFHPATRRRLVKTKIAQYSTDTGGDYIIQPMVSEQALVSWMGHPYKMTTQVPITLTKGSSTNCTEIYFANWSELLIGMWGTVELRASQETSTAFQADQTWIRIIQEVDVQVRHAESFCLINDATIA
jgi:HK97 family phage major capsid protein